MNYLNQLVQEHNQDIDIFYQSKIEGITIRGDFWTNWKKYSDCDILQRKESNLRSLFNVEVLIDLDDPLKLPSLLKKLRKDKQNFELWNSLKGYHINIIFLEMENKPIQEIKLIREFYIKRYEGDLSKKGGLVAQEFKPYFKDGKTIKKLITKKGNELNCLSVECLDFVKGRLQRTLHCNVTNINIKNCNLIDYVFKHKLKEDTGRGNVLAKNVAIFFIKQDINKAKEMLNIFYSVQGIINKSDWITWVRNNNCSNFSCKELRGWLRETQKSGVEELTCWQCNNGKTKRSS